MNENNYRLSAIMADEYWNRYKVYVKVRKGKDWRGVLIDGGRWCAVNVCTGEMRGNRAFRELKEKRPMFVARLRESMTWGFEQANLN